jgi:hypothetical protein
MFDMTALTRRIKAAEAEAQRCCGLSDVLNEKLVQESYAAILAQTPKADREATEAALRDHGFDPDFAP